MSYDGIGRSGKDSVHFHNEVKEYLRDSPLTSPIRSENPNLHPVEPDDMEFPAKSLGPRRRKPPLPLPSELPLTEMSAPASSDQKFWKFHLIKFGNDMYLTTNPTPRHLHCRSFPGYYIAVSGTFLDYTMTFEHIETGTTYFKIRKHSTHEGEFFRYKMRRIRRLEKGRIVESEDGDVYENFIRREAIPEKLLPSPPDFPITSYLTQDFQGKPWSVGSVPRVRESRISHRDLRYIGKHSIYLHDNFRDTIHGPIIGAPPVRCMFRPSDASVTKRAMRSINKLLKRDKTATKIKSADLDASMFPEISYYYKAGDGLYGDPHPLDDDPDKHLKYGWLSIYEDEYLEIPGMFDLVVCLSVAIAYDFLICQ